MSPIANYTGNFNYSEPFYQFTHGNIMNAILHTGYIAMGEWFYFMLVLMVIIPVQLKGGNMRFTGLVMIILAGLNIGRLLFPAQDTFILPTAGIWILLGAMGASLIIFDLARRDH